MKNPPKRLTNKEHRALCEAIDNNRITRLLERIRELENLAMQATRLIRHTATRSDWASWCEKLSVVDIAGIDTDKIDAEYGESGFDV